EVSIRRHLVGARRARSIGIEEEPPAGLTRIVAVDPADGPATAARHRTERHLRVLRRRRRDAPHTGEVVTGVTADDETAGLSEPVVVRQRIPAITFIERVLRPLKRGR